MSELAKQIIDSLPPKMQLPDALYQLFEWIESQGNYEGRIGSIFDNSTDPYAENERPSCIDVCFYGVKDTDYDHWLPDVPSEIADGRFYELGSAGGDGSIVALWLDDDDQQKFVLMGSGSGSVAQCVLADNAVDFLRLLAIGYDEINEPWVFAYPPNEDPDFDPESDEFIRPNHALQQWVKDTFNVTIPERGSEIVKTPAYFDDGEYDDPFWFWMQMPTIVEAASRDNFKYTQYYLDRGVDINYQDSCGWSALSGATFSRHKNNIEKLLALGADVNLVDKDGENALFRLLNVNGARRLMDREIFQLLLASDADTTITNKAGHNLLSMRLDGFDDIDDELREDIQYLESLGLSMPVTNKDGKVVSWRALARYTVCKNHTPNLLTLIGDADINALDSNDEPAAKAAFEYCPPETCLALLDKGVDVNAGGDEPLLFELMQIGEPLNPALLKAMLERGAKLDSEDEDGTQLIDKVVKDHEDYIDRTQDILLLLDLGANINRLDWLGSPIFWSLCLHRELDEITTALMDQLIDRGLDINLRNDEDETLLTVAKNKQAGTGGLLNSLFADSYEENHFESLIEFLLKNGGQ